MAPLRAITLLALLLFAAQPLIAAVVPAERAKLALKIKNWGLLNRKSSSHIHAFDAWNLSEGSKDVVVAVIDTGVDVNHPDLIPNIWTDESAKLKAPASLKDKSSPRQYGWDFVKNKPNPSDEHGHGTHVAGIIGAISDPQAGVSGVAHHVSIMPIKYYSEANPGSVNLINTIKALHYAIDRGARIINYSGGGPEFSEPEYEALKKAQERGVLVVAAAGNERQNTDIRGNYYYPAAYGLSNIISVAAINIKNGLLPSSNWGVKKVEVAAPGENIYSTLPNGRYGYMSGTSQATAFVTGIAALLLSKDSSLTPEEVKSLIYRSVDQIPSLKGKVGSSGKVNAYQALLALQSFRKGPPKLANLFKLPEALTQ